MKTSAFEKRNFNLIEIVISLAITVVVLVCAMSLIPGAMKGNQEAVNKMAASNSADQLLNTLSSRLELNWAEVEAIPSSKSTADDSTMFFSSSSFIGADNLHISYQVANVEDEWDYKVTNTGVFNIQHKSESNTVDFSAVARVWKEVETYAEGVDSPTQYTLHCELSWPRSLSYSDRHKKMYSLRVFKPGVVAYQASRILETPKDSVWAIETAGVDTLNYYCLDDDETLVNKEGNIEGLGSGIQLDVDGLSVSAGGDIYFINNSSTETYSTLYKINSREIDLDDSTPVEVTRIGQTNLRAGPGVSESIGSLAFVDNKLYGINTKGEKIYELSTSTGQVIGSSFLKATSSGFKASEFAVGADKVVYVLNSQASGGSELWKFEEFPNGSITKVMNITGSGLAYGLTAHPDGFLIAADSNRWYRLFPSIQQSQDEVAFSAGSSGIDFCWKSEALKGSSVTKYGLGGTININPSNNSDFEFEITLADGTVITRDELMHNSDYTYEGGATNVRVRPKGNGNQNGLTLNGEPYDLKNGKTYSIVGDFNVKLHNSKNGNGNSMGKWYLEFLSGTGTITEGTDSDEGSGDDEGTVDSGLQDTFSIDSGSLVLNEDTTALISILGAEWGNRNSNYVTVKFTIDGKSYTPFGSFSNGKNGNVNYQSAQDYEAGLLDAGSEIAVFGRSMLTKTRACMTVSSAPSNQQVLVLTNGDYLPSVDNGIASFASDYIDSDTGRVTLEPNQVLYFFELGTTDMNDADYQDLVVLITLTP